MNGLTQTTSPVSRETKHRRATYDSTQQKPTRTDSSSSSSSSSSRQRPNSRPNSRPTISDLFALSPEQISKQQQKLKEIGWTQQRVNETTDDDEHNKFGDRNEGTDPGDDQIHDANSTPNKNNRIKLKKLSPTGDAEKRARVEGVGDGALDMAGEATTGAYTTLEWQNELARHILSMYASTTAVDHLAESKAILEFVDTKRSGDILAYIPSDTPSHTVSYTFSHPPRPHPTLPFPYSNVIYVPRDCGTSSHTPFAYTLSHTLHYLSLLQRHLCSQGRWRR